MMRGFLLALLFAPIIANAASLEGTISLVVDGKPLRAEEAAEAVFYFRPASTSVLTPSASEYSMSTERKQFVPRILPIMVGGVVRFPNEDVILHNAFSTSKNNAFDVGLYSQGEGHTVTFEHAGYVRVYCNVHHSMIGHILVLDTPYFTHPDAQGHFKLANLPEEPGDLVVWHDRAKPWHIKATPGETVASNVLVDLNLRRIPQHMNKFGKPYTGGGSAAY
jgi:plastocyanin